MLVLQSFPTLCCSVSGASATVDLGFVRPAGGPRLALRALLGPPPLDPLATSSWHSWWCVSSIEFPLALIPPSSFVNARFLVVLLGIGIAGSLAWLPALGFIIFETLFILGKRPEDMELLW